MKLTGKQLEQIAHEIKSTTIKIVSINKLPIGETCVSFNSVDGKYQAFFNSQTDKLTSLLQIKGVTS